MDHLIYTAMSGANAAAQRQAVLANNLANASTQGFRAELSTFRAVPVRGDGATTRVFALEATSGHDSSPGAVQRTGRSLDVQAQGNAWFAVQGLDGTEAYSRSGALQVSSTGTLVNSSGLVILSDGGSRSPGWARSSLLRSCRTSLGRKVGRDTTRLELPKHR